TPIILFQYFSFPGSPLRYSASFSGVMPRRVEKIDRGSSFGYIRQCRWRVEIRGGRLFRILTQSRCRPTSSGRKGEQHEIDCENCSMFVGTGLVDGWLCHES